MTEFSQEENDFLHDEVKNGSELSSLVARAALHYQNRGLLEALQNRRDKINQIILDVLGKASL